MHNVTRGGFWLNISSDFLHKRTYMEINLTKTYKRNTWQEKRKL